MFDLFLFIIYHPALFLSGYFMKLPFFKAVSLLANLPTALADNEASVEKFPPFPPIALLLGLVGTVGAFYFIFCMPHRRHHYEAIPDGNDLQQQP